MNQVASREYRESEFLVEPQEFPVDTFHIMSVPSSPVASGSPSTDNSVTPTKDRRVGALEDMFERQNERSMRHYRPWSSPINSQKHVYPHSDSLSSPRNRQCHHHVATPSHGHTGTINTRNKHNVARQFRSQHRQDQIDTRRTHTFDTQVHNDFQSSQPQCDLDVDHLLEEERQFDNEYDTEGEDYEAHIRDFESDLEHQQLIEELEMAELISNLDLGPSV